MAALDSGSDFENDLKKQNNNFKNNPKISESSSEVSSGENEEEIPTPSPSPPPVNKDKLKSLVPNKTKLLMKQRENLLEGKKKISNMQTKPKSSNILPSSSMKTLTKSLSLSESSDSDSEDTPPASKKPPTQIRKSSKKKTTKLKPVLEMKSDSDDSGEEIDFSSQLESLVASQTMTIESKKDVKISPKKSPIKASSLLKPEPSNIAHLLMQAEGVSLSDSDENTEENDTKTEVKEENEKVPDSISIELPHEDAIRRRKKKGFDMEAWVRRELGRAQRELQMLKHQAHVACLLAHLRYLNSFAGIYQSFICDNTQSCVC